MYDDQEGYDPEQESRHGHRVQFANAGSALRASSRSNPRNLPCPTCGAKNKLTPADVRKHYQCDDCARRDEGGGF